MNVPLFAVIRGQLWNSSFFVACLLSCTLRLSFWDLWRSERECTGKQIYFSKTECTNLKKWPAECIETRLLKWCGVLGTCLIWQERWGGIKAVAPVTPPPPHLCVPVVGAAFHWVILSWYISTHSETASDINQATRVLWMSWHCFVLTFTHTHTNTRISCSPKALGRWDV